MGIRSGRSEQVNEDKCKQPIWSHAGKPPGEELGVKTGLILSVYVCETHP